MIPDEKLDAELDRLRDSDLAPPPMSQELQAELGQMEPARPRAPLRQLGILTVASLVYAGGLLALFEVRHDMAALPRLWMVLYVATWLSSFVGIAYLAVVPPRGQVMSRWRAAGIAAALACLLFTGGGLLLARHAPGLSTMYEPTVSSVIRHGAVCFEVGIATALVPIALATLFLRRVMAVRARWVGAAIGAASGSLGGFFLHLHCPIAERFHLGLVHGGVVVLSALLCALILPRFLRP